MSAKITQALHAVMSRVGYVQKKGKNTFHKYSYASEADLLEALRPAMLEAGLLLIPSAVEQQPIDQYGNTQIVMEYTLAHKDGDVWPDKIRAFGCGGDMNSKGGVGDKGTYKAITGANKYLLFKLFQIETGDDPENSEAETAFPARPAKLSPEAERLIQSAGEAQGLPQLEEWFKRPSIQSVYSALSDDERRQVNHQVNQVKKRFKEAA